MTTLGLGVLEGERHERSSFWQYLLARRGVTFFLFLGFFSAVLVLFVSRSVRVTLWVAATGMAGIAISKRLAKNGRRTAKLSAEAGSTNNRVAEVRVVSPATDVTPQELLRVAASAASLSNECLEKAIVQKALEWGMPVQRPDDFLFLPGKGIHCWIDEIPTLIGFRPFLVQKGVCIPHRDDRDADTVEIYVAQGCRLLGSLAITVPSLSIPPITF